MKKYFEDELNSMLCVLRLGISLEFEDGNKIISDVSNSYIEPILEGVSLGLWIMDFQGLVSCLKDLGYEVK